MKSKEKKRSLNELRQTKEYYKSPLSHTKSKNQKIKFTKKELLSFSYGMFVNIMGLNVPSLSKNEGKLDDYLHQLENDLEDYVQKYFNEK